MWAAHKYTQHQLCTAILLLMYCVGVHAQQYDLLLTNGHVIDPKNKLDATMDIAISNGSIAKVEKHIAVSSAKKTVDVAGLYVVPGLIDMHTHVFVGSKAGQFADGIYSVSPDDFSFRSGVTTVVDAGTAGWQNFPLFKTQVIDQSQTRILAFINVFAQGLITGQAVKDTAGLNAAATTALMQQYNSIIVGTRIGHYDGASWLPFTTAVDVATSMHTPVLVECHLPQYSLQDQLERMRPGDIITHAYEAITERMAVVDSNNNVRNFVLQAQQRGVLFDVGHGGAGFWFSQAMPAFRQGLVPNTFGTDLHRFSMNAGMKSMLNLASKYLNMGMPLQDVITRATWNAARALHHEELGNFSEGSVADIAVLQLQKGLFGFVDAAGKRLDGDQKLEAALTIRAGKIVWDLNGLAAQPYEK
ncbi:amidohydrolase/deacetylase family metallohydrolase [Panacibacter microcysteis]|nr:amidohydrolase/deacetylase family metallohydrolase [Panacibacter microcysteis]